MSKVLFAEKNTLRNYVIPNTTLSCAKVWAVHGRSMTSESNALVKQSSGCHDEESTCAKAT